MAKFTKYNNPNKKRRKAKLSRTDADIVATKKMVDDKSLGYELPIEHYDELSDKLCGKPSRDIY